MATEYYLGTLGSGDSPVTPASPLNSHSSSATACLISRIVIIRRVATRHDVEEQLEDIWEGKNLAEVFPQCFELLSANTGLGLSLSASDPDPLWIRFVGKLFEFLAFNQAVVTLSELYRLQCVEQGDRGDRIHKGWTLHNLGAAYLSLGRHSIARRCITLAHIEDVITHGEAARGMAYSLLVGMLSVPAREIQELSVVAAANRGDNSEQHPEAVLLKFQEDGRQSRESESRLFRPNLIYSRRLFDRMNEADPNAKGRALEHLVTYLITSIEGFELAEFRQVAKDHETDIVVRNAVRDDPLFEVFGQYIGVECKNWADVVGAKVVNHFIANLRFAYLRSGVLVARSGISGGGADDKRDAELAILKAFHQDNIIVCVIDEPDLKRIIDGEVTLPRVLLDEYERIRFDKLKR